MYKVMQQVAELGLKSKQSGSRVDSHLLSTLSHHMWPQARDLNCLGLNFFKNEKVGFDQLPGLLRGVRENGGGGWLSGGTTPPL